MNLVSNLKIQTKLNILVLSASVLMIIIGFTGLAGVNSATKALSSVYNDKLLHIIQLNEVRDNQSRIRAELLEAERERDGFEILAHIDKVRTYMFHIETALTEYNKQTLPPDEKKIMDAFMASRLDYGRNGVLPVIDLLQAEKFDEAHKLSQSVMVPGYTKASDAIDNLIQMQVDSAKAEYERVTKFTHILKVGAIITIIAGLALSIVLGLIITRSVNAGVRELAKTAARLSDGDLTARVKLDSKDELGEVARAFNQMASEFSSLIAKVRQSTQQVIGASKTQATIAEKVSDISSNQKEQASNAAISIEQVNASVQEIAAKTTEVASYAGKASATADEGQQIVNRAVMGIQQVALTVKESAEQIATLGQRSDQIGQIINVIQDIAEQTNLLALNAAIEAARAGEQGRGFAVVADEVRKLAERTSQATSEISDMISTIQEETRNVVTIMEKGSAEVNDGVNLANQAGASLQNINASIKRVVDMIELISNSTRSQSEATSELTVQIEHIADMAKDNTHSIDKSTRSSHDLQKLSAHLQDVVSHFRL